MPFAVGMVWSLYYHGAAAARVAAAARRAGGEARPRHRPGARRARRRAAALRLCRLGAAAVGAVARGARRGAWRVFVAEGWIGLWRVLRAGGRRGLSGDAVVLALGAAAPIANPLEALAAFSHEIFPFPHAVRRRLHPADRSALGISAGLYPRSRCPSSCWSCWRRRRWWPGSRCGARRGRPSARGCSACFMLGFAILFPVAYAVAIKAVLFDGMRHFIFVLPPIAGARGAGRRPRARPARRACRGGAIAYGALALYGSAMSASWRCCIPTNTSITTPSSAACTARAACSSSITGPIPTPRRCRALEDYLRAEYGADFMDHDFTVAVCGPPASAAYYFPQNFIFTPDREAGAILHRLHQGRLRQGGCRARRSIASSAWARCCRWCIDRRDILARTSARSPADR